MYHRAVYTQFFALFIGVIFVTFEAIVEPSAESQVTACIFIEERIIEEHACIVYWRIIGDEGDFTKISRAFIHCDHLFKHILIFFCSYLYHLSVFELYPEIFDELALI